MKLRTSFLSLLATVLFIHQTSASVGECSRYRGGIHNRNSNQTPVNYLGRFHTPQVSIDQNEVNIQPNADANKSNTSNLSDNADSSALSLSKHYKRNAKANNESPPNPNIFEVNVSSHSSPNPYQFNSNRSSPSPWNQYRYPLGFGIFTDSPDLLNQHWNNPWPPSPSRPSVNSNPPDLPDSDALNANTNNSDQLNPNEHDANTSKSNQLNLNGRNAYTNNSAQLNLKLNLNGRNAYTNDSGQMNSNERNAYTKKSNQLRPNSLHSSTNNANAQDLPNSNGFNSNTNSSSQQNQKRYDANSNNSIPLNRNNPFSQCMSERSYYTHLKQPLNRNNPFSVCMSERSYTHLKQPLNRNNPFSVCMSERSYTHLKQPLNRNNPFRLCLSERSYITHSKQPRIGSNNAEIHQHKHFGNTHSRSKSHPSVQYSNTSAYSTTRAPKRVGNRYIGPKSSMTERLKRHKKLIHRHASFGKMLASQHQLYHQYQRNTAATTGSHNLSQSSKIPNIPQNFEMVTKVLKNRIPQNQRNINKLAHSHSKVSKDALNCQSVLRHNRSSNQTERGKRKGNVNDINNYPYRILMPDMSVSHPKLREKITRIDRKK
eukprot:926318_1